MPLPTAVPRCSLKRSIAARMSSRLCVGDCTTDAGGGERHDADARGPRLLGDERARASCAATMRLGLTSVARMLPETSIARITVSCCDGSVTTAVGRAIATEQQRQRHQEQERRNVAPQALAAPQRLPDEAQARVAKRGLLLPAQEQHVGSSERRDQQQQPEHFRPGERHHATPKDARAGRRRSRS